MVELANLCNNSAEVLYIYHVICVAPLLMLTLLFLSSEECKNPTLKINIKSQLSIYTLNDALAGLLPTSYSKCTSL